MQLTIEVLPAPLGPMGENNSPSFTPKLTQVSARTPPKRSDTPRISKAYSTFPPLRALLSRILRDHLRTRPLDLLASRKNNRLKNRFIFVFSNGNVDRHRTFHWGSRALDRCER